MNERRAQLSPRLRLVLRVIAHMHGVSLRTVCPSACSYTCTRSEWRCALTGAGVGRRLAESGVRHVAAGLHLLVPLLHLTPIRGRVLRACGRGRAGVERDAE